MNVMRAPAVWLLFCLFLSACGGGGSTAPPISGTGSASGSGLSLGVPSSDWPQYRRDDQRTGDNSGQLTIGKSNAGSLALKWSATLPYGAFATPVVVGGTVYQADLDGHISAFSEATGNVRWSRHVEGSYFATPTYSGGKLYAPNGNGSFAVLDPTSGDTLWQYPVVDALGSYQGSPIVRNGTVYQTRSNANEDFASTCETGNQVLTFDANSPALTNSTSLTPGGTTGVGVWSSPAFDSTGSMYLATGNSCSAVSSPFGDAIIKMNAGTLNVYWHQQQVDAHDLDFGATPLLVAGMVVDSSKDGNVYAFDANAGTLIWKTTAGLTGGASIGSPATDGRHIFVPFNAAGATAGGAIVALNMDGSVAWSHPSGAPEGDGFGTLSTPAVSNGVVYVGDALANCTKNCFGISGYDADSGALLWRFATPGPIYGGVSIVDGGVFVAEFNNGTLYCFTPGGK